MSTLPDGYSYQVDVDDCETETALIFELDARGFDATAIEVACTMWHDDNAQHAR